MKHEQISRALCGRYTQLSETSGYLESHFVFPHDGSLLGAYILEQAGENVLVTDDGNVAFQAAVAGATITASRAATYRAVANRYGIEFDADGKLTAACSVEQLGFVIANFFLASSEIARTSLRHRPGDEERFERTVGEILQAQFGVRVIAKPRLVGLSGHQLQFPFAVDLQTDTPTIIQPIAAMDGALSWQAVYGAGGKFKDLTALRSDIRLVAVLENATDVGQASNYFADTADVYVYGDGPLQIATGRQ